MYAASAPLNRGFSGTSTGPAPWSPSSATTHSWMFGAQMATRSPASTPEPMKARVACSARSASSANVSRTRSSTTASRSENRSAALRTSRGTVPHSRSPRISGSAGLQHHDRDLAVGLGLVVGPALVVVGELRPEPGLLVGRGDRRRRLHACPARPQLDVGVGLHVEVPGRVTVAGAVGGHDDKVVAVLQVE